MNKFSDLIAQLKQLLSFFCFKPALDKQTGYAQDSAMKSVARIKEAQKVLLVMQEQAYKEALAQAELLEKGIAAEKEKDARSGGTILRWRPKS